MTSQRKRSAKLRCTAKRSQKFEKPRQLQYSISEATARNVCYPESWARYICSVRKKPSHYLHYNTAKWLHSPTNPASGNFCWERNIDKFEGCTFNINVFCGDQSKIARLNENWSLEAQTGITYIAVALLVTFHKLLFQLQAFSLSLYEQFCFHSLTKFALNSYFCPVWTGD